MIEKGKYTFIIVTKNNEDIIRRTLSSIKLQNYKNFEAIVIDDNSSDYSTNIVYNEFCKNDSRFKLIAGTYKHEYIDAANEGIEQASGEFIQFIIPGIYYYSQNYLNEILKVMNSYYSFDAISFQTTYKEITDLGTLKDISAKYLDSEDAIRFNTNNSIIIDNYHMWNPHGAVCKKSFIDEHNIKFTSIDYPDFCYWTDIWSYGAKMNLFVECKSYLIETYNNFKNNFMSNEVQYLIAKSRERYAKDIAQDKDQEALFNRTAKYFLKELKNGRK